MINTYSSFFIDNVGYCSDSNGHWRYENLFEIIENFKYNKLQVLIHPIWWSEKKNTPYVKMTEYLINSRDEILNRWIKNRHARGRKIIGYPDQEKNE